MNLYNPHQKWLEIFFLFFADDFLQKESIERKWIILLKFGGRFNHQKTMAAVDILIN